MGKSTNYLKTMNGTAIHIEEEPYLTDHKPDHALPHHDPPNHEVAGIIDNIT